MRTTLALLLLAITNAAASDAVSDLEFDAASIKVSKAARGNSGIDTEPGILRARSVPLKVLVRWANGLKDSEIVCPSWMESAAYDIAAKASSPANDEAMAKMLQALLVNRFKLATYTESKQGEAWNMVVAKSGARLSESTDLSNPLEITRKGSNRLTARRMSMEQLANYLTIRMDRPVIDHTGLKGRYDITLDWSRDDRENYSDASSLPSIFNALQDQLGLKLDAIRMPSRVLIVDGANKVPTAN